MRRFLFIFVAVSLFSLPLYTRLFIPTVFAQTPTVATTTPTSVPVASTNSPGDWVQDPMVTFLGKAAYRSENFMNWTLANYKWDYLDSALVNIWRSIRNIVYALSVLAVMVTGFLIIIKGGKDVGIMIFTKEFIVALLFVTFSYAIARFIYQITDIFQLFFFQTSGTPNGIISGKDIVNISFASQDFLGFRKIGIGYDESAFVSLLLIQLSSVTFYVIGCLLTIRKIILWFFLISAPLYPIVLLYKPIKNTGKIWVKEFLRWLLYAPLFAVFLSAVVIIWKTNILVLPFNFSGKTPLYPTSISILLGGPGQQLSLTNSLNYPDTFIQYVVALIMLWAAILMPFILLQFFLDFLEKYDYPMFRYIDAIQNRVTNNDFAFLKKPPQPGPQPTGQFSTGGAREIFRQKFSTQNEKNIEHTVTTFSEQQTARQRSGGQSSYSQGGIGTQNWQSATQTQQANATHKVSHVTQWPIKTAQFKPEILEKLTSKLISFPIPTMRDIVNFETARLKNTEESSHELQQTEESLEKIANPKTSVTPFETERFTTLREQLNEETTKGDVLAKSILSAASTIQKPEAKNTGKTETPIVTLPTVNEIQTVSFDDYEAVKSLWLENYEQLDTPEKYANRRSWIENDEKAVAQVITQLSSPDPIQVRAGLSSVASILPFLLIGGFSQTEVIAYLKAKLAAGKSALKELAKKEEDKETLLARGTNKEQPKELRQAIESEEKNKNDRQGH
jgi:hypothetical protein